MSYQHRVDKLMARLKSRSSRPAGMTASDARHYNKLCAQIAADIAIRDGIAINEAIEQAKVKVRMLISDPSSAVQSMTLSELDLVRTALPGPDLSQLSDEELQAIIQGDMVVSNISSVPIDIFEGWERQ